MLKKIRKEEGVVGIVILKVKMGENERKPQLKPWKRKSRPTLMTQMP
jgi:hypothetical protein